MDGSLAVAKEIPLSASRSSATRTTIRRRWTRTPTARRARGAAGGAARSAGRRSIATTRAS